MSTPLWVIPDGVSVAFWTPKDTGKVKRIRNSGRVEVTACDIRGKTSGETVPGQARFGDEADRIRIGKALGRKYGLLGRITLLGSRLRRGVHGTVIIIVDPA